MENITATIITLNEEKNIADCIKSLHGICNDIIVLDSLSNDNTCNIACSLGARVFSQAYLGDGPQKSLAATYAKHKWILSIDADERLDEDAKYWIQNTKLNLKECYAFKRKNFIGSKWIKASGLYPDYVVRLYHIDTAKYNNLGGHAKVTGSAKIKYLPVHLKHYTLNDYNHLLHRIGELSTRDAQVQFKCRKNRIKKTTPILHAISSLFRKLILKGGIFQGLDGWTVALSTTMNTYMKYLKLLEYYEKEN